MVETIQDGQTMQLQAARKCEIRWGEFGATSLQRERPTRTVKREGVNAFLEPT